MLFTLSAITSFLFDERKKVYIRLPHCNKNLVNLTNRKPFQS